MLTFFTIPKPFTGHMAIIQRNAIKSWLALRPHCEVLLLGDDKGVAEIAGEWGLRHITDIDKNEFGTPLVPSIFSRAEQEASNPVVAYVNADIVLMTDFLNAVSQITFRKFLMVGQRYDLDVSELIRLEQAGWEQSFRADVDARGTLHAVTGLDYFVYRKGLWRDIPPFAIGRTAWDNWLVYGAKKRGAAIVNATEVVRAVHQNHDYAHITDPKGVWVGDESLANQGLAPYTHSFDVRDADWQLTDKGLVRNLCQECVWHQIAHWPILHPRLYRRLASVNWRVALLLEKLFQ